MKFKRKIFVIFILLTILYTQIAYAATPDVASEAAILVESSSGKILYEKNAYEKMYPASTTKVMTAILTLENCDLNDMATVSHNAIFSIPNGYVNANLQEGEEISVKDLMYALMVKSANDAAIVLAEHIGGSVENFANMMNEKAKELGCQNTHFVNPNGIHNDNHYTTAYDLYLIASYGMKNETFRQYVSTTSYTLPATNKYALTDRICITTNDMLRPKSKYYNENVIGIKTGYTTEAKNCLISAAKKNDIELLSVVLHAGTNQEGLSERYVDTTNLFNYGFEDFAFTEIVSKDFVIKNIDVENGSAKTKNLDLVAQDTLSAYISKDIDVASLSPEIKLNDNIEAPIQAGTVLGQAIYTADGITYSTNLLAKSDVDKSMKTQIILLSIGIFLLFFGVFILRINKKHRKKRKHRK